MGASGFAGRQGIEVSTYLGGKLKTGKARVTVVVDGQTHRVPFGNEFVATDAGPHEVSVFWALQRRKVRPTVRVNAPQGGIVRLRWDGPRWIWQSGRLSKAEGTSCWECIRLLDQLRAEDR